MVDVGVSMILKRCCDFFHNFSPGIERDGDVVLQEEGSGEGVIARALSQRDRNILTN
jgi:hypothetical protein